MRIKYFNQYINKVELFAKECMGIELTALQLTYLKKAMHGKSISLPRRSGKTIIARILTFYYACVYDYNIYYVANTKAMTKEFEELIWKDIYKYECFCLFWNKRRPVVLNETKFDNGVKLYSLIPVEFIKYTRNNGRYNYFENSMVICDEYSDCKRHNPVFVTTLNQFKSLNDYVIIDTMKISELKAKLFMNNSMILQVDKAINNKAIELLEI